MLLAARDEPTSVSELAALMGTTKQAASKLVESMVAAGYVQRGAGERWRVGGGTTRARVGNRAAGHLAEQLALRKLIADTHLRDCQGGFPRRCGGVRGRLADASLAELREWRAARSPCCRRGRQSGMEVPAVVRRSRVPRLVSCLRVDPQAMKAAAPPGASTGPPQVRSSMHNLA